MGVCLFALRLVGLSSWVICDPAPVTAMLLMCSSSTALIRVVLSFFHSANDGNLGPITLEFVPGLALTSLVPSGNMPGWCISETFASGDMLSIRRDSLGEVPPLWSDFVWAMTESLML